MPESSAAVTGMPGDLSTPTLAPVYADGMPLAALGTALSGTSSTIGAARFWSTPPREASNATREVLEISLGAARTVNTVTAALPRFPHTTWLQALDEESGTWNTLSDAGGNAATITITDSLPPVITVGVASDNRRHPAHHGAGHWLPVTFTVTPTMCTRLRLVQVRITTPAVPIGPTGTAVPYPLGVRDVIIGYDTGAPAATPLRTGTLATSADVLGSTLTHTVRRADAWGLLLGRTWRSAPQAVPDAVVSLYLDCRDDLGNPQVIDRLHLDPITTGVSMCVYYATDAPAAGTFPAADTPLGAATTPSATNPTVTAAGALSFTAGACYLDIAAGAIGFNPATPFTVGITYAPGYASTAAGPYTLLDVDTFSLTYTAGLLTATLGSTEASVPVTFTAGTTITAGATFDGSTLSLTCAGFTSRAVAAAAAGRAAAIRLGGALGSTPGSGAMVLSSLALWQCATSVAKTGLAAYLASASSVMNLPTTAVASHPSNGIVLRVDARLASDDTPFGVFGAPNVDFQAARWTPLAIDAVARAGTLPLPAMSAALVKIEFTNLAPAPFDTSRAVTVSAPLLDSGRQHRPSDSSVGSPDPGIALITANGSSYYSDMRRLPTANAQQVPPTEALYAPDPRIASAVDDTPGFGFVPWQSPASAVAPRGAGAHLDAPVQTSLARRAAFWVALRSVGLGRYQAGTAATDYARIVETMGDARLLTAVNGPGLWTLANGRLFTDSPARRRVVSSTAFATHRPVVAVQFAAICSDAAQMLPDADFTAVNLSAWAPVGDATLDIGTGYASAVGHTATVTRHGGALGGISSVSSFTPGRTGRLHAAVRLYAPTAATGAWTLSLVNADGTVLASASSTPGAGQVVEFTCSLGLDSPLSPGVNQWSVFDTHDTWSSMRARGTWAQISGLAVWVRGVTVQLTQAAASSDVVYVDSLALFYDPITWEVSVDGGTDWFSVAAIRNNPAGVLVLPPLSAPATAVMWRASCDAPGVSISAVALRPWYELRAGGIRPDPPGVPVGPLLSPADHYGPIEDDPMWLAWDNPVPRSWWSSPRSS